MALDFMLISSRTIKGVVEVYPKFIVKKSKDLMIRGGDFYAMWDSEEKLWITDPHQAVQLIDRELKAFYELNSEKFDGRARVLYLWDSDSGMIDKWHKYCQKQMRDSFKPLDEKLMFMNDIVEKDDYVSKILPYPLEDSNISGYNKLMDTLYDFEERMKLEWSIGAILCGDAKTIQKFIVLYGSAGTGKSTILNIIQMLFEGFYSVFDAKALGSASSSFALEAFRDNPLVAIQHDGDLSKIEDNTRLNSLVSHELMTVNEKFKSTYSNRFQCFLYMGTNKPVRITDAKSGLIRRLIDVSPSGRKVPTREYHTIMGNIKFELGGIASHCLKVYKDNIDIYDNYIPVNMLGASNDFYNFVQENYLLYKNDNATTLKHAWDMYKVYCDDANVPYPMSQRLFKEELKNYFKEFYERYTLDDGTRVRNYYLGFLYSKFNYENNEREKIKEELELIKFQQAPSLLDEVLADRSAQYAKPDGTPRRKWADNRKKLKDLKTDLLHYVILPEHHIVIDFDIPGDDGEKSLERNLEAASKWPTTYAELSKSGKGIHLHYYYTGDVKMLEKLYDKHIEIKTAIGFSALRRKLTTCSNHPIATLSSGLPTKGAKMVELEKVKSENGLRQLIIRNLNKEIHPSTKSSVDFIFKILEDAYDSGTSYDLLDMQSSVISFGASSTNQAEYCLKLITKMKFQSEDKDGVKVEATGKRVFYDIESFKNLFVLCWKIDKEPKVYSLINPSASELEPLMGMKLIGFNNRKYDNHVLYAAYAGYNTMQLYQLSQDIINSGKGFFREAYNLSYTDVYDFSSKKQSLKKFQIELGIHHQELGIPWDQEVPEHLWDKVVEYCKNDVVSLEDTFYARHPDFVAREILSDLSGLTVNDTTNQHSTKIIFGDNKKPQSEFNYRDMGDISKIASGEGFEVFDKDGRPIFPGYVYENGKSIYRGVEVGEGGYVYAEPGMYSNVALIDVTSMHPTSAINEELFGPVYTKVFSDIVNARVAIKNGDFDRAKTMLNGALAQYLDDISIAKDLSNALKIVINSVYGLTSAKFENAFRDPRNKDNIVAKRGALFMINLQHAVQERGYIVAHIKTDSIKIANATPEIIEFVHEYGKLYGYNFEHEATYEKFCLVNNAVYAAKYLDGKKAGQWTTTGTQFSVPYVYKNLFSGEEVIFDDMAETKSVTSGAIYLDFNENLPDVLGLEEVRDYRIKGSVVKPTRRLQELIDTYKHLSPEELQTEIDKGHDMKFVGRVGRFCPILPGNGGAELLRVKDGKNYAVTGSSGFRWLEAEGIMNTNQEHLIDVSYYEDLLDDAKNNLSKHGDLDWFLSNDPNHIREWHSNMLLTPCWSSKLDCYNCPNGISDRDGELSKCKLDFDVSGVLPF